MQLLMVLRDLLQKDKYLRYDDKKLKTFLDSCIQCPYMDINNKKCTHSNFTERIHENEWEKMWTNFDILKNCPVLGEIK